MLTVIQYGFVVKRDEKQPHQKTQQHWSFVQTKKKEMPKNYLDLFF